MASSFPFPTRTTAELVAQGVSVPAEAPATGTLAGSPVAVIVIVTAWASTGLVAAYLLHRRGHEFGPLAVLGAAFGPLFIGVARAIDRGSEGVEPLVLAPGQPGGGPIDVLIAVDGSDPGTADVGWVLGLLEGRVGRVALARTIDYESARDPDWSDAKRRAARDLAVRAEALEGYEPARVLLPGPIETAFTRYAARSGYDVLIVGDGWRAGLLRTGP